MKKVKNFDELYRKSLKTSGADKLWNYFLDLIKTKDFKDSIEKIKKSNISTDSQGNRKIDYYHLRFDLINLALSNGLDGYVWEDSFYDFAVKGKITRPEGIDVCKVMSWADLDEETHPDNEFSTSQIDVINEFSKAQNIFQNYPIVMLISPFASLRDIQDFVEKNYTLSIENYKKAFSTSSLSSNFLIGKSRKKKASIQERNDFIWENRHLPHRKIMKLLYEKNDEKFEIDYAYIGKIISLEKKKRKEV